MAINIRVPQHSFVQFNEVDAITSCNFPDLELCLPVYDAGDVSFQFVLETDSEAEADELCDLTNNKIKVGIVEDCGDAFMLEFSQKPERFRIGLHQVLYNWSYGLPGFTTVRSRGECFMIKIVVDDTFSFCSNCFQRIINPCHTSVIEYSNDDDFGGFNYCNSAAIDEAAEDCEPTIIEFTNLATLVIPYTAGLVAKHGTVPTVQCWLYDENSILVDMGIRVSFDTFPPTRLIFSFGGTASGVIKLS